MAEVKLTAERRRGKGKGVARKARAAGKVPGILYGRGMEPVAVQVDRRDLAIALHTDAGMNVLLDIDIDGEKTLALTRELQRDPVRGTLLHADFVKVDRTQEIEVEVPVHLTGEAPGVKEGGVLEHQLFTVHVRCLPAEVPERIEADISGLGVAESLKVADVADGLNYTILNDPDVVVAMIAAPVSQEELEAMEAAVSGGLVDVAEVEQQPAAAVPEGEDAAALEEGS
ncbi:MAG: 50S ribosomal protein L25/general stress protein Ctc [Actinomycetota bacterium]